MRGSRICLMTVVLILILLATSSCGEIPTARPIGGKDPTLQPTSIRPPTVTPMPYPPPRPTQVPWTAEPTPLPAKPIVLGAEEAPPEKQETYISTTIVLASVGDGPGEVGFQEFPGMDAPSMEAEYFTLDIHGNIFILDRVNHRVVQFDPQGGFVTNIPYGDEIKNPGHLAVDAIGHVYIYERSAYGPTRQTAVPKIKVFNPGGSVIAEIPKPSWLYDIERMQVGDDGALWVSARGAHPDPPVIEGKRYSRMTLSLGNAAGAFDEAQQRSTMVSGHMCNQGTYFTRINHFFVDQAREYAIDFYDLQGNKTYTFPAYPTYYLFERDRWDNMYLVVPAIESPEVIRLYKFDTQGRLLASFVLTRSGDRENLITQIDNDGSVYAFLWNWDSRDVYRIIRWQSK